jgi:polar amino acid transport system substrate-binding protein
MFRLFALLLALLAGAATSAQQRVVRLTSLEWPPYTGAGLPENGASVAVVRAAFEAMGYRLEVDYRPWLEAVDAASRGVDGAVGYFPEYASADVSRLWWLSAPIGRGPLGFVESARRPVRWQTLADLRPFEIGVVAGYVNTDAFDTAVRFGDLRVQRAADDRQNLQKVAEGRLRLAVMDRHVYGHLVAANPVWRDRTRFNDRLLEDKLLHVAFRRDAAGEAALRLLNVGLTRVNATQIQARLVGPEAVRPQIPTR